MWRFPRDGAHRLSLAPQRLLGFAFASADLLLEMAPDGRIALAIGASEAARPLLDKAGVIQLKDDTSITATPKDIVENPKGIKVRELEAATLPRVLKQVDLALINTNYALEAGLNPAKDALVIEGGESPYVNILVARKDNKDGAAMQKLAKALQSDEVKAFIADKYKGAVVPAL